MTRDGHWNRVRDLFEAAAELAPEARPAFLAGLAAHDAPLKQAVARLLAADAADDGFLEPPLPADRLPSLVGRRVGGYRIVRAIASGGMGTVWEAEQDQPRRKVAIKTLHAGLASPQARRRFHFEAELLANLRHPGIAQVFSAGFLEAEGGVPSVPWFALEFVEDACPLTRYAEDRNLDLHARLRLFQSVCRAVQHAHQRGVVHRDLKAANLLVDGHGQVKVIDFGIARPAAGAPGSPTLAGEVVGTLESMSPEQVEGRSAEVDARTDVYALGVVLYRLATGRNPYELEGLPLPEAARRIREAEPARPSRVARGVPREIDWIVARAMAKEPIRRYAAASDLDQEIQRLLDREPVQAGPPSRGYRLRKFCQRHRAGVAATLVAVLAALLGLAGVLYGLVHGAAARAAAAESRADARLVAGFTGFFRALFGGLRPEEADGRALDRTRLLAQGAAWVRAELAERPLVQTQLLRAVGEAHAGFAEHRHARALLQESIDLARAQGEAGAFDLAEGLLRRARVDRHLDDADGAAAALREALAIEERLFGAEHPRLGAILNELGVLLARRRPEEALAAYRRSHALTVAGQGEESGDAAMVLANMAAIEMRAQRYALAQRLLEQALPVVMRQHGETDPRVGSLLNDLATVHRQLGDPLRALELQLRDLEVTRTALGAHHPDTGMVHRSLALIHEALGDGAQALAEAERALAILTGAFADTHPQRIDAAALRARLLARAGQAGPARAAAEAVLALAPQTLEGRRARLAGVLVLAELDRRAGESDAALAALARLLADPAAGSDARLRADAHFGRAFVLAQRGDVGSAEAEREQALAALPAWRDPAGAPQVYLHAKFATLGGDPHGALRLLGEALARGYRNAALLIDPDFAALRALPGFAPLAAGLLPVRRE
ncbi:MAG: serine/threonine protein kinase [Planctomycetes bacterium]|nr:serine/threonine protein kinase [Planctomycetota bacterium]